MQLYWSEMLRRHLWNLDCWVSVNWKRLMSENIKPNTSFYHPSDFSKSQARWRL